MHSYKVLISILHFVPFCRNTMYRTIADTRILLACAVLIFSASCGNKADEKKAQAANQPKAYRVLPIQPKTATLYSDYPATLQGTQVVEIRPRIDGYIKAIHVDEGATVRKGQLLFTIDAPQQEQEVRTQEAAVLSAEANVRTSETEVKRIKPLVDRDIISKYQLQTAENTLASSRAALAQARAALANARSNFGFSKLTSPVDGVIGTLPYKIGALVNGTATTPLTTVSSTNAAYAYFAVNEKQLLDLTRDLTGNTLQQKLKQLPEVQLILADGSLYDQKGRIETASGFITTETGSSNARATFPNPTGLLHSGNSGVVRLPRTAENTIVIPQSATYELQGKRFVYTVGQDSTATATEVKVDQGNSGKFFVVKDGLKPGVNIVIEGVSALKDGTKIVQRPANADSLYTQLLQP